MAAIGPAVFNGGLSTFLAFILVAFSDSYVFLTFFKVSSVLYLYIHWVMEKS